MYRFSNDKVQKLVYEGVPIKLARLIDSSDYLTGDEIEEGAKDDVGSLERITAPDGSINIVFHAFDGHVTLIEGLDMNVIQECDIEGEDIQIFRDRNGESYTFSLNEEQINSYLSELRSLNINSNLS